MRGIGWATGLLGLVFLFGAQAVADTNYQDYLSALPESIQGMERTGDPEGVNRKGADQDWSAVEQSYADDKGREAKLTILAGTQTSAYKQYKKMSRVHMENPEKLIKSLEVSGYDGVMDLDKTGNEGTVALFLGPETLVVLEAEAVTGPDELQTLAEDLPLEAINGQTP
ncbi:hypothetical protein [Thiohalorhabdus sp.]|uniref:hypothetical protein n=1 Tax=Thiohalorhabdus sp. TaxID=3094134 RepID=UPI002FC318A2